MTVTMTDLLLISAALFLVAIGLAARWVGKMGRKW